MPEAPKHILVVDDDTRLRNLLQRYLREQGFLVSAAEDASKAEDFLSFYVFDLLIVDIMMPKVTGTEFLQKLRKQGNLIPVILLTAMGEAADRVSGLEIGADDYIPKPFEPKELVLRINNILKRTQEIKEKAGKLRFYNVSYDINRGELLDNQGQIIHITPVERLLLSELGKNPGEVHTREELASLLGSKESLRTVDVQITRLRKKIEVDTKNPRYLQTVRGKGYMLISE
ncbi:MAG: response regulator transcription factor [Alphaproteobacteria bacterium]|nr:response regulator transcription factor [Alphaproteobacteria bacterium]